MFYESLEGKPSYSLEANKFFIFYAGGWKIGRKESYGLSYTSVIHNSHENKICPLHIKRWKDSKGEYVNGMHIYGEHDINHIINDRGMIMLLNSSVPFCTIYFRKLYEGNKIHWKFHKRSCQCENCQGL